MIKGASSHSPAGGWISFAHRRKFFQPVLQISGNAGVNTPSGREAGLRRQGAGGNRKGWEIIRRIAGRDLVAAGRSRNRKGRSGRRKSEALSRGVALDLSGVGTCRPIDAG